MEKATSGHPNYVTTYYLMIKSEGEGALAKKLNESIDHLRKEAGKAWLDTNSIIFHHTLEYQKKMTEFFTESSGAIEALHDHIWEVVMKVMEDAGKPMADGLRITLHLVDMLPTVPLQLAFNTATLGLTGFAPEVYAAWPNSRMDLLDFSHAPPPRNNQNMMTVLHEEIIKMHMVLQKEKAIQPTWLMSITNVSTISVRAAETGGSDGPSSSPCMSHSPVMCASHSPVTHASHSPAPHATHSLVPHSPSKSPSLGHHFRSSRSSSSSSGSSSGSRSASSSSNLGSLESGSGDKSGTGPQQSQAPSEGSGSGGSECSHSTSPEIVLVQGDDENAAADEEDEGPSDDEEVLSQGTVLLLDISSSNNEEACKAAACKKACKSDVQFAAW